MSDSKGNFHTKNTRNKGFALLLITLIIIVVCTLVWLWPSALSFKKSNPDMPWNQEFRILRKDEKLKKAISPEQTEINQLLYYKAKATENNEERGYVDLVILPDGKARGTYGGDFYVNKELHFEVIGASFKGNIDPSFLYEDENGQDPTRLYFITRGNFLIMETHSKEGFVRKSSGYIYVTGWIGPDYNLWGRITLTSNKRTAHRYFWQGTPSEDPPPFHLMSDSLKKDSLLKFIR